MRVVKDILYLKRGIKLKIFIEEGFISLNSELSTINYGFVNGNVRSEYNFYMLSSDIMEFNNKTGLELIFDLIESLSFKMEH